LFFIYPVSADEQVFRGSRNHAPLGVLGGDRICFCASLEIMFLDGLQVGQRFNVWVWPQRRTLLEVSNDLKLSEVNEFNFVLVLLKSGRCEAVGTVE
jgi:hypothetical protein